MSRVEAIKPTALKVVRIGNSRGIRLPKALLEKYRITDAVLVEAREDGLLLRSKRDRRLSWKDTFRQTAAEREDWQAFESTVADGLDEGGW